MKMKKIALIVASLMMLAGTMSAQNLLKYNYKKNNLVYTGTERIRVPGSTSKDTPVQVKLSRILFSDGQPVFLLRLEFEDEAAWKMSKNAPMTVVLTDGRSVVANNSSDAPNAVAPNGIKDESGKTVYLNYGEYYFEEAEIKKLASGISSIDVTKRWSAEGAIKNSYKNDELGKAISQLYDAIADASAPEEELGSNLKSLQDQSGSRLAETEIVKVNDKLSLSLVYLYYAPSNAESIDLNLYIPGYTIPFTSAVKIQTKDGSAIELRQEKDLAPGRVICYPSNDDIKKMAEGVTSVTVETTSDDVEVKFSSDEFAEAIDTLYNSLQTVAIL